ncbi:ABC transporter permease [Actinomadura rugatobispora]|uniref:ABC transporter permease n=1 Tax=Actinomadura rugatobispora TaxID=1994 RepID=A0ABW1AH69_9ACTN|nr:FtsX-like permease family protein [Actinomadura rugatobispora]
MLRTTLAGLRAHKLRLLLTAVAITLGVGFIGGTFVLTDAMDTGVQKTFARSAGKVDVAVLPGKDSGENSGAESGKGLPADMLARIRAVPGVREAHGLVRGDAALVGRDGKVVGDMPTVGLSVTGGRMPRFGFDEGRAPNGPGEAVLDSRVASRAKYRVGDTITVLDPRKAPHRFTVVGLVGVGLDGDAGFRGAVGFDPSTAARMTGERTFQEIDVAGASPAAVAAAAGRGDHRVMTGERLADELATAAGADTEVIRTGLLLFGLVAVLVSALVIYNTFSILIAQRMREMALLRCVGATRRQIFAGVLAESAAVGLVGSLLGLAAGLGLGAATLALLGGLGVAGPAGPALSPADVTLAPRTVLVGLAVGVVVTVLAALLPARGATRVAPVAALRSDLEPGTGRFRLGRARTVLTVLFAAAGTAVVVLGSVVMDKGQTAMFAVAAGGALVFLAVIAVMPALVRPLGRVVGALPGRAAGVPGRLAVENARRAPRRTATTTIALTIGVGLMSLFAVIAASGKATSVRQLDEQFPMDFQIQAQYGGDRQEGVPAALGQALRGRPEIGGVVELRQRDAEIAGREGAVATITQSALGGLVRPEFASGSLEGLRPGAALVDEETAKARNLRTGQTVTVQGLGREPDTADGGTGASAARRPVAGQAMQVKVAGIFTGDVPIYGLVLTEADFGRMYGAADPYRVFVKAAAGVPAERARAAVEAAAEPYPAARFTSAAELREEFTRAIDTVLLVFGGLLALAIVIALFGIANTLTLSVVERTRESALLRALGLTKRQLRRMLSVEALVMAVIGALTGVVLGVVFGWASTRAMGESAVFALPWLQVAGFMLLAGVAGMLAAVLPARRAARASIVESLSYD